MAPTTSRPHPYRATSDVETPGGIRAASWFAGPGSLPAGINPPPDRPILVIVDYSPLQELAHPSERDHALYSVLANHNFRCTTAGELEALFTWTRQIPPDEASSIQFSHLRPALTTRLRTQWDIHMVPSDLEFRYAATANRKPKITEETEGGSHPARSSRCTVRKVQSWVFHVGPFF